MQIIKKNTDVLRNIPTVYEIRKSLIYQTLSLKSDITPLAQ